jgi:hypothetical protein
MNKIVGFASLLILGLSSSVRAQSIADTSIVIYVGHIVESYNYPVFYTDSHSSSGWEETGSLTAGVYITVRSLISSYPTIPTLTLDTGKRLIPSLYFEDSVIHAANRIVYGPPDGGEFIAIRFDSIPYVQDSVGDIFARGLYRAKVTFRSNRHLGMRDWMYNGSCSKYDTVFDSVSIQIIPSSSLAVNSETGLNRQFSVRFVGSSMMITCDLGPIARPLEIIDAMGRCSCPLTIPAGQSSVNIENELSPGLYFARLGNQVAKFVVPPR